MQVGCSKRLIVKMLLPAVFPLQLTINKSRQGTAHILDLSTRGSFDDKITVCFY